MSVNVLNPTECGGKAGVLEFPSDSRAFCNLSSIQLDLQRPKSAVREGLRGSESEASVDIWFKKSRPPPPPHPSHPQQC